MTHTDTTRALFRAVWDRPEDDTARLVYADALDDAAGCETERAEFIRVQCDPSRWADRLAGVDDRLLHAAHRREWARVPCPKHAPHPEHGGCTLCAMTGDLFQRSGPLGANCGTPHWHRGFVGRVDVPALSWVCKRPEEDCGRCDGQGELETDAGMIRECPSCDGKGRVADPWRVTPWALAVAAAHPVTEWVIPEPLSPVQELPPAVFRLWAEGRELPLAIADVVRDAVVKMWASESRTRRGCLAGVPVACVTEEATATPLTEQQIDAEVSRYEPYLMWAYAWCWSLWSPSFSQRFPSDVPLAIHRHLKYRFGNYAPTREAALADLRNAIRAAHGNGNDSDHETQN